MIRVMNLMIQLMKKFDKLNKLFKEKDYLKCEKTRKILEAYHLQTYFDKIEPDIKQLCEDISFHCKNTMSSALKFNKNNEISGMIVGTVYKYLNKNYDFSIFEDDPDLGSALLREYEEKKNRREYK